MVTSSTTTEVASSSSSLLRLFFLLHVFLRSRRFGKRSEGIRHFVPGKESSPTLPRIIDDDTDDDDDDIGGGGQQQHKHRPLLFVRGTEKKTIRQTIPRVISALAMRRVLASLVLRARYNLSLIHI